MLFFAPLTALFAFGAQPADYLLIEGTMAPVWEEARPVYPPELFGDAFSPHPASGFQIRIERRIRIRIPRLTAGGRSSDTVPAQSRPVKWKTRKIGKCIAMNGIEGVQLSITDNRLMLYMRDRRIIRADLEKACPARSFYSGFLVEQSRDGQLCVNRDTLLARSGTKCEVARLRQMVADD